MFRSNLHKIFISLLVALSGGYGAASYTDADLGVAMDFSRFSINGGVRLDINLMVPQKYFTYIEGKSGLESTVIFQTALIQEEMVIYGPDRWQRIYRAPDQAAIDGLGYTPDISTFNAEAGEYLLQIDILDVNSNRRQRIQKYVSLDLFPSETLSISDLTIASQIVKAKQENEFTKYGHDIVPNAERTFTTKAPMLYYYYESYGLTGTGNYSVHNQVLSLNDDVVQDYPAQTKKMPGTSVVEWGGINTIGLKSGIHKLLITVTDESNQQITFSKKTFYVLRQKDQVAQETQSFNSYQTLTLTQLDELFEVMSIIMDKKERLLYTNSDLEGKRNILNTFWDRQDPDPETPRNEYKTEFYQLVQLANREYGLDTIEGWKTDRGRVLIRYGRPNNIERNPYSLDQKPWELWEYYEIEGGAQFVFVDRTGYGQFQLVHSTARNETQDYEWQRYLD